MMIDARLKVDFSLAPGTIFLGGGGVEKWVSPRGIMATQATASAKPQLRYDGLYFDGADTLGMSATPDDFNFGAGEFTIEWWSNQPSGGGAMVAISPNTNTYAGFQIFNHMLYMSNTGGTAWGISGMSIGSLAVDAWTHYAVSRDKSGVVRSYNHGIYVTQATLTTAMHYASNLPTHFGSNQGANFWAGGILADFRLYKSCIYQGESAFIPPERSQPKLQLRPTPSRVFVITALLNQFDSGD